MNRKIVRALLTAVLGISALICSANADCIGGAVTKADVNLRSGAGTDTAILDTLPSGTAVVVTDAAERAAVYAAMDPGVQALYATPEDGGFTAFYIEHGVAKYAKDGEGFTSFKF